MSERLNATQSASRIQRKIAWLSPLPPQQSGVSNYSYQLLTELRRYFEIHLYSDEPNLAADLVENFSVHPLSLFRSEFNNYDEVIYHLGNHCEFHKNIYELAWEFPGTIVLHDYNLSGFLYNAFYLDARHLYEQAKVNGFSTGACQESQGQNGDLPEPFAAPMSHAIVARSKRAIVHHRWVKNQFGQDDRIKVIPHFAKLNREPERESIAQLKHKLGIRARHFVLTCPGFVNSNKLPQLQIKVVQRLLNEGYPVKMIFAGAPAPEIEGLAAKIRLCRLGKDILFTGYQDEAEYFNTIFASDVIINLRNPTLGEASGTLMHALAAHKPTIISDVNQYREFPDNVCWKITHDESEAEVLYEYLKRLLSSPALRIALSRNVADFVRTTLSWEKIIAQWVATLSR
jgi:glycosyltransferase involved in cell wall biosynthesis